MEHGIHGLGSSRRLNADVPPTTPLADKRTGVISRAMASSIEPDVTERDDQPRVESSQGWNATPKIWGATDSVPAHRKGARPLLEPVAIGV